MLDVLLTFLLNKFWKENKNLLWSKIISNTNGKIQSGIINTNKTISFKCIFKIPFKNFWISDIL